ncbi:hypothetical protein P8452_77185 [Trifolium repens]|nr:hypothetical protein P8452_77185 [Trifolium repens]
MIQVEEKRKRRGYGTHMKVDPIFLSHCCSYPIDHSFPFSIFHFSIIIITHSHTHTLHSLATQRNATTSTATCHSSLAASFSFLLLLLQHSFLSLSSHNQTSLSLSSKSFYLSKIRLSSSNTVSLTPPEYAFRSNLINSIPNNILLKWEL